MGGDMIEVYRLVCGLYDSSSCIALEFSHNINMWGNRFSLANNQFHYDARKYFFVNLVTTWNSLSNEIVTLTSVDSFKYHLDIILVKSRSKIWLKGLHGHVSWSWDLYFECVHFGQLAFGDEFRGTLNSALRYKFCLLDTYLLWQTINDHTTALRHVKNCKKNLYLFYGC